MKGMFIILSCHRPTPGWVGGDEMDGEHLS